SSPLPEFQLLTGFLSSAAVPASPPYSTGVLETFWRRLAGIGGVLFARGLDTHLGRRYISCVPLPPPLGHTYSLPLVRVAPLVRSSSLFRSFRTSANSLLRLFARMLVRSFEVRTFSNFDFVEFARPLVLLMLPVMHGQPGRRARCVYRHS